jgi:DivIVA domain-containing protein
VVAHAEQRGTIGFVIWFLGIVLVLVVGGCVVVAAGRGGFLRPVYEDRPDVLVPADEPLTGAALRSVRFTVGLRGYRMDEVDALLARLAEQLDQDRDVEDRS